MAGAVVVGYYLDMVFGTAPLLAVIFFIGGVGVGVNTAGYIIKKFKKVF